MRPAAPLTQVTVHGKPTLGTYLLPAVLGPRRVMVRASVVLPCTTSESKVMDVVPRVISTRVA